MGYLQALTTLFRDHLWSNAGEKGNGTLLDEVSFSRALAEEDRRARRGGRPYLLMLVEIGTLKAGMERNHAISCIASVLRASTRETDVLGWVGGQDVIGVLFTGIGASEQGMRETYEALTARIREGVGFALDGPFFRMQPVSPRFFPGFVHADGFLWKRGDGFPEPEDRISLPVDLRKAG